MNQSPVPDQRVSSGGARVLSRIRVHLTYANVISSIALFLALSTGGAYAATMWTGANIKNGTLTSADVKNQSLKGVDVKNETLGSIDIANGAVTGAKIAAGAVDSTHVADGSLTGADIADNTITTFDIATDAVDSAEVLDFGLSNQDIGVLFAQVNADGTLANSSGTVTVIRLGVGTYEVDFGRDISASAFIATQGEAGVGGAGGAVMGATDRAGNVEAVFVTARDFAGVLVDRAFHLVVVN